jgi:Asp-tRNA(Asn)/Glu-tRNA(Gln) amidotransferase A subunit family amidase
MTPTNYLTASETVALVSSGGVSLEQVIQDHQERYQQRNDDVRAWVTTNFDNAKKAAGDGPLRGVTIGVKDMMSELIPLPVWLG